MCLKCVKNSTLIAHANVIFFCPDMKHPSTIYMARSPISRVYLSGIERVWLTVRESILMQTSLNCYGFRTSPYSLLSFRIHELSPIHDRNRIEEIQKRFLLWSYKIINHWNVLKLCYCFLHEKDKVWNKLP